MWVERGVKLCSNCEPRICRVNYVVVTALSMQGDHCAVNNRNGAARKWMRAAPSVSVTDRLYSSPVTAAGAEAAEGGRERWERTALAGVVEVVRH